MTFFHEIIVAGKKIAPLPEEVFKIYSPHFKKGGVQTMEIDHATSKYCMDFFFLTKLAGQKQIKLTNLLKEGISGLKQKK